MFITPVSSVNSAYAPSVVLQQNANARQNALNPLKADTVSFSGNKIKLSPEQLKNQLRILLSQNIWAEKLEVRMPENDLEKEVILEVLEHRKNLDRFTRLKNERGRTLSALNDNNELIEHSPSDMELRKKSDVLRNKLTALDKQIETETKKRKHSIEYFDNIDNLADEYLDNNLIKQNLLAKTWDSIVKNNINKDKNLSTQDLIDIISGKKQISAEAPKKPSVAIISKKHLKAVIEKEYTQYLRETVNLYMGTEHGTEAVQGRKIMEERFAPQIKRFLGDRKELLPIYHKVENMFAQKTVLLGETDIYPIGEIWQDMDKGVKEMKELISIINATKDMLAKTPDDVKLQRALKKAEKKLAETKKDWTGALTYSINYEKINRERFAAIGSKDQYDFLTTENKTINRYKELANMAKENKGVLPENVWAEILA